MNLQELDPDTIALIIELQREDLERLAHGSKGKHREGEGPDSDYAFEIYQEELATLEASVADHRLGITIGLPEGTNEGVTIETGVNDRSPPTASSEEGPGDGLSVNLQGLDLNTTDEDPLNQPESSAWGASRADHSEANGLDRPESRECISCQEQHDPIHLVSCPCSHKYCQDCLTGVFEASITDETMFPPRCCSQPIPLSEVEIKLPADLVVQFKAKKLEFETPNRIYCHEPSCSAFIPADSVKHNVAHCPQCSLDTCSICKKSSHQGECPEDPALQEILRVAAENGWQRCTKCGRILELNTGCYHMSKFPCLLPAYPNCRLIDELSLSMQTPLLLSLQRRVEELCM